jgi:hypothetical protein
LLGRSFAGKSSILYKWVQPMASPFHGAEIETTIPTIGFPVEVVKSGDHIVYSWIVASGIRVLPLWKHYFNDLQSTTADFGRAKTHHGIIWVLSATEVADPGFADDLRREMRDLNNVMTDIATGFPILFALNKTDMPGAASVEDAKRALDWPALTRRHRMLIDMVPCDASTDEPAALLPLLQWVKDNAGQLARPEPSQGKPTKSAQATGPAQLSNR